MGDETAYKQMQTCLTDAQVKKMCLEYRENEPSKRKRGPARFPRNYSASPGEILTFQLCNIINFTELVLQAQIKKLVFFFFFDQLRT